VAHEGRKADLELSMSIRGGKRTFGIDAKGGRDLHSNMLRCVKDNTEEKEGGAVDRNRIGELSNYSSCMCALGDSRDAVGTAISKGKDWGGSTSRRERDEKN